MKALGVLGAVISWGAVCALLWLACVCLLAAVTRGDGTYAAFAVAFGASAAWIGATLVRE